jgi:hypothetical protein
MVPQPGEASDNQPLMISQRMRGPGTAQSGTWVAAGAIDDEGTARITQIQSTPQSDGTTLIEATHVLVSGDDQDQMIELRSEPSCSRFRPRQHRVLVGGPGGWSPGRRRTLTSAAAGSCTRRLLTGWVIWAWTGR